MDVKVEERARFSSCFVDDKVVECVMLNKPHSSTAFLSVQYAIMLSIAANLGD